MDAFMFQLLPDLAFRDVVQGMEPIDIFHVTQSSQKTQCLMGRNANLPITLEVWCDDYHSVEFKFCGSKDQSIVFEVNPSDHGPHSRLYKFGKDKKEWSKTSYCDDDPGERFGTRWRNRLDGYKTIINFLADTFHVRSVSFKGSDKRSLDVFNYIVDRKLPIQKLEWDSGKSNEAVVHSVLQMATAVKEFRLNTPREKKITFNGFPEYSLDSICFNGANWITRDGLCALSNCLEVRVDRSVLTSVDLNAFLKHLICNKGRAKEAEISSYWEFDMKVVFDGIEYEEIMKDKEYTIKREDGVKMNVKYRGTPSMISFQNFNPHVALIVKVLDLLGSPRSDSSRS